MRKIPTLFLRDQQDMSRVTDQINPLCDWVLKGEGIPTRKYDGTCVMLDSAGNWWARREVKPGKVMPPNYVPIMLDDNTGKMMGWEPIGQSAFARFHQQAIDENGIVNFELWGDQSDPSMSGTRATSTLTPGTYELVGPKVNGNPEDLPYHLLVRHGYNSAFDARALDSLVLNVRLHGDAAYPYLRDWLRARPRWEGVVWHHPDGRMAKLKRKDFRHG